MTIEQIISGILEREGAEYTNDPDDPGGPTKYGVTAKVLGEYRKLGHDAAPGDVMGLAEDEARALYREHYIAGPRFQLIPDEALRVFMVDYGVNHGRARAIKTLQQLLGVEDDGVLGPHTLAAVFQHPPFVLLAALVRRRIELIAEWMHSQPFRTKFYGLFTRAASFLPHTLDG